MAVVGDVVIRTRRKGKEMAQRKVRKLRRCCGKCKQGCEYPCEHSYPGKGCGEVLAMTAKEIKVHAVSCKAESPVA